MRILIWSGGYPPDLGGVEFIVQGLARSLTDRGHAVQVVTQSRTDTASTEPTSEALVHRLPFHQVLSGRDPAAVAALTRTVTRISEDFSPHVVHVHAVHPQLFFLLRTAPRDRPIVFTLHGWTPMAAGSESMRMRLLARADWITGCSQHVVERAIAAMPAIGDRALTICNGCPTPPFGPGPLPFSPPRIVCVGRLVESKGIDVALRAFAELSPSIPAVRLRIVGDGPLRRALEQEAETLGVAERTEFAGTVSRDSVFEHLDASTVLAMPSRGGSEGLPLAAIEAALMERPVVASRDGGLSEAVVDGVTGFLVQDAEPSSIARSIRRVLDDRELAVSLGRAGRARALEYFGWDSQVSRYTALYARAAGRNEPR
jgi:phosphatidylinositol alpha-1,6-mannosyltransferase